MWEQRGVRKSPCIFRGIQHRECNGVLRRKGAPGRYIAVRICAQVGWGKLERSSALCWISRRGCCAWPVNQLLTKVSICLHEEQAETKHKESPGPLIISTVSSSQCLAALHSTLLTFPSLSLSYRCFFIPLPQLELRYVWYKCAFCSVSQKCSHEELDSKPIDINGSLSLLNADCARPSRENDRTERDERRQYGYHFFLSSTDLHKLFSMQLLPLSFRIGVNWISFSNQSRLHTNSGHGWSGLKNVMQTMDMPKLANVSVFQSYCF